MYLQAVPPDMISGLLGLEGILGDVVGGLVGTFLIVNIILIMTAFARPWAKRKITAAFADRTAANQTGPFGPLTIVTDVAHLLSKEFVVLEGVDCPAWDLAPMVILLSALLGSTAIPMGNGIQLADPETGFVFAFAATSITSLGIVMTGYAPDNRFSLINALHVVAVNIAYEIPLVVTAALVVIFAGSLRMSEIITVRAEPLFPVAGVTVPTQLAFVNLLAFTLFVIANPAEVGRNPFDISEVPTEIVAEYQIEYLSVYFVLIYLGEFIHTFLGGAIVATLFLGGPAGPVPPGFVWFTIKTWAFFLFIQWARFAMPRLRVDQFLEIGWKGMLVLSFANPVLTVIIVGVIA